MVNSIIIVVTRLNELFLLVILLLLRMVTIIVVIWNSRMVFVCFVEHYRVAACVRVLRLLHGVMITGGVFIGMLRMLGMLYVVIMLVVVIVITLSFWVLAVNEVGLLVIKNFIFYAQKLRIKPSIVSAV